MGNTIHIHIYVIGFEVYSGPIKALKRHTDHNPNICTNWKFSDMHYSNYISAREASIRIQEGVKGITATPTALKQTHKSTIELLLKTGIKVEKTESKGRPRKIGESDIKKLLAIRHSGTSFYKISSLLDIPKSTAFDYCKRHGGAVPGEREIRDISIEESNRIFGELLRRDLDDEVNDLARRGKKSEDLEEIEEILREIEIILYC